MKLYSLKKGDTPIITYLHQAKLIADEFRLWKSYSHPDVQCNHIWKSWEQLLENSLNNSVNSNVTTFVKLLDFLTGHDSMKHNSKWEIWWLLLAHLFTLLSLHLLFPTQLFPAQLFPTQHPWSFTRKFIVGNINVVIQLITKHLILVGYIIQVYNHSLKRQEAKKG